MNLQALKTKVVSSKSERDLLKRQLDEKYAVLSGLEAIQQAQEAVQLIIQRTAKETQEMLKIHITELVQSALDVCFADKYEFVLEFETKRGRTECGMYIRSGNEVMDPMNSNGLGLVDIVALALRIAALSLSTNEKILMLDEPLKFLSNDLKPVAAEMFASIAHRLGIQILMVSHDADFVNIADKKFKVKMVNGKSEVTEEV